MSNVRIADLKARLSEHLRSVRNGSTLTVLDRDTPVARIVPYSAQPLEIRRARRPLRDLKLPPAPAKRTDSAALDEWLEAVDLVLVRTPVLTRASDPMPMSPWTLDALHLATALTWRDRMGPLPMMVTHDTALGLAAQAFGFDVRGI